MSHPGTPNTVTDRTSRYRPGTIHHGDVSYLRMQQTSCSTGRFTPPRKETAMESQYFDTDYDGIVDTIVTDTNGDGYVDVQEWDTNADGWADEAEYDYNYDGYVDEYASDTDYDGFYDVVIAA